ncbi:immunoglobulin superfamily member 10 isoform X2 [Episyrphus balteatus]|uniref:immunoglobulin superfamily member 10 isoform X2 n=1 Tax=Episyrphus balteatus TaxID=286459 RepID=UPI002486101C|nr:immunoglobulin superfamily member 10 isoform X2 [Episyrphus balteatus]
MTKRPNDITNSKKLKRRIHHHQEQEQKNLDKENQEQQQQRTTTAIVFPTIDPSSEQTSNINFGKPKNCIAKQSSTSSSSSSNLGTFQKTLQPLKEEELSVQITAASSSKATAEQPKATITTTTATIATATTATALKSSSLVNSKRNPPLSRDLDLEQQQLKLRNLCIQTAAAKKAAQTMMMVTPNETTEDTETASAFEAAATPTKNEASITTTATTTTTTTTTTTPLTRPYQGVEVREASSSSSSSSSTTSSSFVASNSSNIAAAESSSLQVFSSSFSSSRRKPKRKLLQPSLDCFLVTAIFSTIFLMVGNFQIGGVTANSSLMGSKHEPMFISRSETFKFVASDTIVLPCEVANTDSYVVAWKRGIAILTAGSVKVTPDPRVRLINGYNLQIRDAAPQDAGDYICQIAMMEPREITHTVEILVPPRIHHISTGGHLQVKKGSSVRIECSASGNPTPNVTWSRKNNILPSGEEKLHSHILSIENVDRHKGGVYICTANNGVGQPASSQVVLHVLYPPEISVERPTVFSGEGHEAMLVCIVHGETQPEVIWFKDTMQLDTTERHIMENRGSRHTLIIRKVHPQDFGNYSCVAENQLGKSRKTLQLSGKPNVAVFNSPQISQYKDRYNISWTVDSYSPVEEFKLSFRRLPQGHEVVADNTIEQSNSMLQVYNGGNSGSSGNVGGRFGLGLDIGNGGGHNHRITSGYGIHWSRNDWRDVVLPAMPLSHHYTQGMSYMIRALEPDQHYEATVQARNRYGWSDQTHSFLFSTSSNDNEMRDLSVTFYGGSGQIKHTTITFTNLSILCITSILVMIIPRVFT